MKRKNALILIILLIMFISPILIARYYFAHNEKLRQKTANHGQLIQPVIPLTSLPLKTLTQQKFDAQQLLNKWVLLYINPHSCAEECRQTLYSMRQIRTALGKNMDAVARILLTLENQHQPNDLSKILATDYPGTLHLQMRQIDLQKFVTRVPAQQLATLKQGYIYLVDPLGNIMMAYSVTQNPQDIYKDLERLLKVANIGKL